MFETDFVTPQRKMAVGGSISSEKWWHFCQMRPVKTANAPSCWLLPLLQIDMARSQNWFWTWFKMANGKTEYQRTSTSVSWSWCDVFSFDWKPCRLCCALIQLDAKTKGGLKVQCCNTNVARASPGPYLFPIKDAKCFMSHTVGLAHCLHYLDIGICQQGPSKEAFQSANAQNATFSKVQSTSSSVKLFLCIPSLDPPNMATTLTELPGAMSCPKGAAKGPILSIAASTDSRTDGFIMLLRLFCRHLWEDVLGKKSPSLSIFADFFI